MDERYQIATPEQLGVSYRIAGIGSRFIAAAVDTTILAFLLTAVAVLGGTGLATIVRSLAPGLGQYAAAAVALVGFFTFWSYFVFFEMAWQGQSPGKRYAGVRVIKEGGYPIRFSDSVIRNVVRLVDFLPAFYAIGLTSMFIDRKSRRLGDFAAGTMVVLEDEDVTLHSLALGTLGAAAGGEQPGFPFGTLPSPPEALLSQDDRALLREYVLRRGQLEPGPRLRLSQQLAASFARKLSIEVPGSSESFLEALALRHGLPTTTSPSFGPGHPYAWRRIRPLWRVAALSTLSFGIYQFYWLFATWRELKDERSDATMRPVWHALAMLVPIYGLFRFRAHYRTIVEAAENAGVRVGLSPGLCVTLWTVASAFGSVAGRFDAVPWAEPASIVISVALAACVVCMAQATLNRTWRALAGGAPHPRTGLRHMVAILLGVILWGLALAAYL